MAHQPARQTDLPHHPARLHQRWCPSACLPCQLQHYLVVGLVPLLVLRPVLAQGPAPLQLLLLLLLEQMRQSLVLL